MKCLWGIYFVKLTVYELSSMYKFHYIFCDTITTPVTMCARYRGDLQVSQEDELRQNLKLVFLSYLLLITSGEVKTVKMAMNS